MGVLKCIFIEPLRKISDDPGIASLASEVEIMINYSRLLLGKLTQTLKHWDDRNSVIGDYLLTHVRFMKVYTQYVQSYRDVQVLLRTKRETCSTFRKVLEVGLIMKTLRVLTVP